MFGASVLGKPPMTVMLSKVWVPFVIVILLMVNNSRESTELESVTLKPLVSDALKVTLAIVNDTEGKDCVLDTAEYP